MQQNFDMQQLMLLARSPAGQKLMQALKQNGGSQVAQAASLAQSGNLDQARNALSSLLEDPQIRTLLQQLEGQI